MKKTLTYFAAILLATACGTRQQTQDATEAISTHTNAPGDSTRYGLACDGCTDSVIVFLPYTGGDPDTFDIIAARKEHRIFGRPHIGDELAVTVVTGSPKEAYMVININDLQGQWCYMASPTLRQNGSQQGRSVPDSIVRKVMVPLEYGIRLKRDNTANSIGGPRRMNTTDEASPVVYPELKRYTEWHIYNGQLILKADTIAGFTQEGDQPESDTVNIELLMRDSLVLRFADHVQGYYRKADK